MPGPEDIQYYLEQKEGGGNDHQSKAAPGNESGGLISLKASPSQKCAGHRAYQGMCPIVTAETWHH